MTCPPPCASHFGSTGVGKSGVNTVYSCTRHSYYHWKPPSAHPCVHRAVFAVARALCSMFAIGEEMGSPWKNSFIHNSPKLEPTPKQTR